MSKTLDMVLPRIFGFVQSGGRWTTLWKADFCWIKVNKPL
jgi:hypothetical protein